MSQCFFTLVLVLILLGESRYRLNTMGIEDEADRTLFVRNLDAGVTEELLFELFIQAGPLVKTKIPKDSDGKQKTFGFVVYKHEVSVPYAMQLLNGTSLYGRSIHVQFRSGSSHSSSPGNSQNSSPANTPNPHGQRTPVQFNSPPYTPPPQMQRSFSSPENLQKHVTVNNMMWLHMQQLEQLNGAFSKPIRRQSSVGGNSGGGSRQQDSTVYRHHSSQMGGGGGGGRSQRYGDEPGSGRHQQHSHSQEHQHPNERSGNRHHDGRGGNRHYYDERGSNRGYQDSRWRRY